MVPGLRSDDDAKAGNRTFYDAAVSGVKPGHAQDPGTGDRGRPFPLAFDVEHARPYAVIGADIRDELFGPVGCDRQGIKVGGDAFTIIGVEKSNGSFFGQSMDNNIYIPYTAFLKKYGIAAVAQHPGQGAVGRDA